MFVKQSQYDEVVRQLAESQAEVTRLQGLVDAATAHEATIQALTTDKETLTGQVTALTSEKDALTQQVSGLTLQNSDLTKENETLRALPGASSATTTVETENANGEAVNGLDKLNEFCKSNAGNVNACLQAVNKFYE